MTISEHKLFEDEVRRVARALWPRASGGAVKLDGRERDGVFDDTEIVHIVEATVSQKKEKVKDDLHKSVDLVKILRREYPEKLVKIWIVTAGEPTADQQALIPEYKKKAKCPIEVVGFHNFSARLIDSASYLRLRSKYAFGSVRNPADDKDISVPIGEYIHLDAVDKRTGNVLRSEDISKLLLSDKHINVIIVGDYGSGKSMTLREIFYELRTKHLKSEIRRFPIYLNLRDHFGQSDPAEALIRHGRSIGMADPSQLVAAWRAGYAILILDGFDEISSTRLVRSTSKIKLARKQAVGLVRTFMEDSPRECSILISGREHYFDSQDELILSLGILQSDILASLNEFTQDQIAAFLANKGINQHIPEWFPSRPLLLGYLVVGGLFDGKTPIAAPVVQEDGWNYILDRVCEREARQIDPILIEPKLVREFVERLASKARNTISRRGPIFMQDISAVFESIFDRPPDEKAETLMLRLPGLTASSGGESSREFIDDDFVDACRAGDITRYVQNPFAGRLVDLENASTQAGSLGSRLSAFQLDKDGVTAKQLSAAIETASKLPGAATLALDLVRVSQELSLAYLGSEAYLKDGFFDLFEIFGEPNLSKLVFQDCYFERLDVDGSVNAANSPKFQRCQIEELSGPLSRDDIPIGLIDKYTEISSYTQEAKTNADILDLDIPLSIRVLLTVLRKLFVQSGRGRRENAFFRGLDTNARAYVADILGLLESLEFARPYKINGPVVWLQNRAKAGEAREILAAPQTSRYPLVQKVRAL